MSELNTKNMKQTETKNKAMAASAVDAPCYTTGVDYENKNRI